jgi:hypothetical protein
VFFEFTLVLPLLLSLVLGIYTGGLAYTTKIAVVEAVREGARFGASLAVPLPTLADPNPQQTWRDQVKARVVAASGGSLALSDVCAAWVLPVIPATTTTTAPNSHCGVPDPGGVTSEPLIHLVKVSASKPARMEFFLFSKNTVLTGTAVARFERDAG